VLLEAMGFNPYPMDGDSDITLCNRFYWVVFS